MKLYQHPDYKSKQTDWSLYHNLYRGKHSDLTENTSILWPLYTELKTKDVGASLLKERRTRTRYLNIPEIIISLWTSFFFRKEPQLNDAALELLQGAAGNVDGFGLTYNSFLKLVLEDYLIYGKTIVIVDALNYGQGLRPFVQLVNPLDFLDWDFETQDQERIGMINAARKIGQSVLPRQRLTAAPHQQIVSDEYFIDPDSGLFTRQSYKPQDDKVDMRTTKTHDIEWEMFGDAATSDIDEIPIVVAETESWIKDVCQETLRHFNLRSSKDSIEHQQAYQKLFITGIDSKDAEAIEAISEHHYPILPKDANVIVVPSNNTDGLKASIANALENAFKVGLNQLRQVAGDSGAVQSSSTIDAEKDDRIALVESTLEEVETIGNRVLYFFGKFTGREDVAEESFVSFNREITKDDMTEFVSVYNSFRDILAKYPDINPIIAKKVVSKLLSGDDYEEALEVLESGAKSTAAQQPQPSGLFDLGGTTLDADNEGA